MFKPTKITIIYEKSRVLVIFLLFPVSTKAYGRKKSSFIWFRPKFYCASQISGINYMRSTLRCNFKVGEAIPNVSNDAHMG